MAPTCEICCKELSKYKCPKCRAKYCSVPCYKKHKDVGCEIAEKIDNPLSSACVHDQPYAEGPLASEDEDKGEDQVSEQKLELLGQSKELKDLLENPHLCNMLVELDKSDNIADDMDSAMQEPVFTELVDLCLQIVEPLEHKNTEM